MSWPRSAGILAHVTSLPGPLGSGDFGPASYEFVAWLEKTGQSLWQMLPLGPTGYGDSPYQSGSTFAGNPLLVSLEWLQRAGLLRESELERRPKVSATVALFDHVRPFREALLRIAYERFLAAPPPVQRTAYEEFRHEHATWLDDYALYAALKTAHQGAAWTQWERGAALRDANALARWTDKLAGEIELHRFIQFQFHSQWKSLRTYARTCRVRIVGDLPFCVAHDSADVWAHPELFELDDSGEPRFVAGVPPDYFQVLGQRWGNPIYRWDVLAQSGYAWWLARLRHALATFDLVRLDHFRGFESYWEIPAESPDARLGRWAPGPGAAFFQAATAELGSLPLIAEDLGVITPAVDALRDAFHLPGLRVLQFAFGDDPKAPEYRPHSYPPHCVVCTGTHDNDTTRGWFESESETATTQDAALIAAERETALQYLGTGGWDIAWDMIRLAYGSVAQTAIVPMQDVLGLGSEARMNRPGTATGNWRWRFPSEARMPALADRLAEMTALFDRAPKRS